MTAVQLLQSLPGASGADLDPLEDAVPNEQILEGPGRPPADLLAPDEAQ